MTAESELHAALLAKRVRLPTDYADYGGEVVRWADPNKEYPDCSLGCRWAFWLEGDLSFDWCICTNARAPRFGLLTFEHQAGHGCFDDT